MVCAVIAKSWVVRSVERHPVYVVDLMTDPNESVKFNLVSDIANATIFTSYADAVAAVLLLDNPAPRFIVVPWFRTALQRALPV